MSNNFGTLLGELKYSASNYGDFLPYSSSVEGFRTWVDYAYDEKIVSSSFTSSKASRFPLSTERGGSNNNRYSTIALVPRSLRNDLSQIRYRVYYKCPNSNSFSNGTGDGNKQLFVWGGMSVRSITGTSLSDFGIYSGSILKASCSLFTTPTSGEWYVFDYNVKMSTNNDGVVDVKFYKASNDMLITSSFWSGSTGDKNAINGMQSVFTDHVSIHNLTGTTPNSTDENYFSSMGPVYVYNSQ